MSVPAISSAEANRVMEMNLNTYNGGVLCEGLGR